MADIQKKIVTRAKFKKLRKHFEQDKKIVVMCHGVYDLLHYGHIEHLREAKNLGDILVVSVTAAPYVNKGPDRPYYNDRQRLEFLASMEMVGYVILSDEPTAITNIEAICPDIFVKGQEFQSGEDGITGNVAREIKAVERLGGRVHYTQGEVHSSSKLLNNYFNALPDGVVDIAKRLQAIYGKDIFEKIEEMVNTFNDLKVLVIGDIIIDEYVFCRAQGLTSKDTVISTRYENEERYLGGSLAIARHISNFCEDTTLLSMMGNDDNMYDFISANLPDSVHIEIFRDENFITPVKRRFLKRHPQRDEYDKLFSINTLNEEKNIKKFDYTKFHNKLEHMLPQYDLVVICDYGHGLIDETSIRLIEKYSKFISLNCQTNSSNYGMNLITKYDRVDTFALDEKELMLAFRQYDVDKIELLGELVNKLNAKIGWLTVGANGAIARDLTGNSSSVPALTLHVKDTVGAGDAFFAISSLCAVTDVPAEIATLLSNAAGAIKTHMVGNFGSVGKTEMLKFIKTLLNI